MVEGPDGAELDDDAAASFIDAASEVTGGLAGAAAGFIVAGPVGAFGGAAAAPLVTRSIRYVVGELRERLLGPREEIRIGTAVTHAAEEIRTRLEAGQAVREDGFFESGVDGRSIADEVIEGVLLSAQRTFEERKVPYHGRLLAGIAFDATVSRAEANYLLRTFDTLSYQQFVLLQVFGVQGLLTREDDWRGSSDFPPELVQVLVESLDLYNRGMISNGGEVILGLTDLKPSSVRLQGTGFRLLQLCGVTRVEDAEEATHLVGVLDAPQA